MRYISTRGQAKPISFHETLHAGLATDGGLYVPQSLCVFAPEQWQAWRALSYTDLAYTLMHPFTGHDIPAQDLRNIIASAYAAFPHPDPAPLVTLIEHQHYILELFHGPSLAFKDFAMQVIAELLDWSLHQHDSKTPMCIIGATSGDTGAAAISALADHPMIRVFILYPNGRVSDVQRRQMTTPVADNVHALAIDGDFDACQHLVKSMFNDNDFRSRVRLSGINSINWVRILAQVVYYAYAALRLATPGHSVDFTVPTGNFGNVLAGWIARSIGAPIGALISASNQNNIIYRAITSGHYHPHSVKPSLSPSMDIQISSNFERALFYAYDQNSTAIRTLFQGRYNAGFTIAPQAHQNLCTMFAAGWASELDTLNTMQSIAHKHNYIMCPHTAAGVSVALSHANPARPMVTLATAGAEKFPDALHRALGQATPPGAKVRDLYTKSETIIPLANDLPSVQKYIEQTLQRV